MTRSTTKTNHHQKANGFYYDKLLVSAILVLIAIGLLMVTSASMAISEKQFGAPFHFLFRQCFYLILGFLISWIILKSRLSFWSDISSSLILAGIFLLVIVMVPGVGRSINGSSRWIGFGPFGLQVSEFVKLAVVLYLAGYLVRRNHEVQTNIVGFIKPMILLGIIGILLLLEPDFGATVVIMMTALAMMYLAGVRLWQFGLLLALVLLAFGVLAVSSPYRLLRLTSFLNPWAHQFNSGYQLTQSLIAFGRGGIFGVGLGGSVQKLFYLPEAHTDFLFAVLAEELGLIGILTVIVLYVIIVWRAFKIGMRAQLAGLHFGGFAAYGFAVWIGVQAVVNMGVNAGLFPTKGLTLPLLSYGGSSTLIIMALIAILLRIDYESRTAMPLAKRFGVERVLRR